jgi:hypothetical protein
MSDLRAQVVNGRIVLDEPTTLPEGTVLDLVVDDEGDDLDSAERAEMEQRLATSMEAAQAGRVRPADDILRDLRAPK